MYKRKFYFCSHLLFKPRRRKMNLSLDLQLPFKLPIKDGQKIISGYNGEKFVAIFNTHSNPTLIIESGEPPAEEEVTIITLNYLPKDEIVEDLSHDDLLTHTVLRSIHYVNSFLDAIRSCFGLNYIYNITISDLPLILLISNEKESFLYVTQPQEMLISDANLGSDEIAETLTTMSTFDRHPEIYLVEKFFDSAKAHLYREELIDAIVDLQTSFEIFIRNTHRLILLKEGQDEKIENLSRIPFRNVIEQHLSKNLNVDLNFDTPGVINEWYKKLYTIRNEVVHNGRIYITGSDAYDAYDAYVNARNYISDKLYENGYLNQNKKVDLNLFRKNIQEQIDHNKVLKRLKEEGIINQDVEFSKRDNKLN